MQKKLNKTLCFDIDGVICTTNKNDYMNSKPKKRNIKVINQLFNKGYNIKIFTARYMGRNNDNANKAKKKGYLSTKKQLKSWGLNYNKLIFGKPSFDLIVDDKAIFFNKSWGKKILKVLKT
tara:strand:+ start:366 stop:728 length:363 start_codon:yes stop_codon:yes gene_type:complete